MNPFTIPLAYKYVAIAVMLAEINYCSQHLQLPLETPVTSQSLQLAHLSNPHVTGFGGTLETERFSFVFFKSGRLRRIHRISNNAKIPLRELQWKQSRMKSLIDSNGAYHLATNWLSAISVDVQALEATFTHSVKQRFFFPDAISLDDPPERRTKTVLLPVFHVFWGDEKKPAIMISIFGPTKEILQMNLEDESFSQRPKDLLKDVETLLAITDSEFKTYSAEERTKLIARFSVAEYANGSDTNFPSSGFQNTRDMSAEIFSDTNRAVSTK